MCACCMLLCVLCCGRGTWWYSYQITCLLSTIAGKWRAYCVCMLHAAVRPVGGGLGGIHTKSHVC